jgi:hypothetical protein
MRIRGRGIEVDGERMPWFYDLEESAGDLKGQLRVEGWEPSAAMNSWYERSKGKKIRVLVPGIGRAILSPNGIFIHESGHHNETEVKVRGSLQTA